MVLQKNQRWDGSEFIQSLNRSLVIFNKNRRVQTMKRFNIKKAIAVCLISSFLVMGSLSAEAFALDYPTKPINLVVGFPPGGGGGFAAQVIVGYFSKKWKQPINVSYKPGGNSIPAVHEVYSSKPDGYTLLIDSASTSSIQFASF